MAGVKHFAKACVDKCVVEVVVCVSAINLNMFWRAEMK
jgi:hypothetical protein